MCERYKWPDKQDVVWRDEDGSGKAYCVFHAPIEYKGASDGEFLEHVFKKIDSVKRTGGESAHCILNGAIFPDKFTLLDRYNDSNPLPKISFDQATFGDNTFFESVEFGGNVSFLDANFSGSIDFFKTQFCGEVLFRNSNFNSDTSFISTTFLNKTNFFNATFRRNASFSLSTFKHEASFDNVVFCGEARFKDTTLCGKSSFARTTFTGESQFDNSKFGDADFLYTIFQSRASFFSASFDGVTRFTN